MKLVRLAAAGLAAATVLTGLGFGAAAPATAAAEAPGAMGASSSSESAPFQMIWRMHDGRFLFQSKEPYVDAAATSTLAEAREKAEMLRWDPETREVRYTSSPGSCLLMEKSMGTGLIRRGVCAGQQFFPGRNGLVAPGYEDLVYYGTDTFSSKHQYITLNEENPLAVVSGYRTFNAQVEATDVVAQSAKLSGRGTPGALIVIKGRQDVSVDADGSWAYTVTGLELGSHTFTVEQYEGATKTGEARVQAELAVAPITAQSSFDADVSKPMTISGTAQPGADVEVWKSGGARLVTVPAAAGTGTFSAEIPAPNAGGRHSYELKQVFRGETIPQTIYVDGAFGEAVSIVTPVSDANHDGGELRFQGRGVVGGKVELRQDGDSRILGSTTVGPDDRWTIDAANIPGTNASYVVTQTGKGNNVTTAKVTLNPETTDVGLTSPTSGTDFTPNTTVTFRGKGEPGATVTVDPGAGLASVSTTVKADGIWSAQKFLGNGRYTFTIQQVAGDKTSYVRDVLLTPKQTAPINKPWAVTTPTSGSRANGPMKFTGTGRAGETVTVKNTTFTTADVTTTVGNDGNWSVTRYVGTGHYSFDVTQANAEGTVTGQTKGIEINDPSTSAGKPGAVSTPAAADGGSDAAASAGIREALAFTGADITGLTVTALALLGAGIAALTTRRRGRAR